MDLALSWAERRRAAGIATPLVTPTVLLPPAPERLVRVRAVRPVLPPLSIPPSPPPVAVEVTKPAGVAQDENAEALAHSEAAAGDVDRAHRPRAYDAARDVAEPVRVAEPVPPSAAEPAPEKEPTPLVCRPAPLTREVLAARRGITHKDIKGDRETELIRRYQAGDRHAGEILLRAHAKFIAYWARKYGKGMHDMRPEDLLSEAQIGFLDGVARFDSAAGCQLTTFAIHRIRTKVQRAKGNTGNTIRVPVGLRDGRAKSLPCDNERVMAMRAVLGMRSLDAPLGGDNEDMTLLDSIADTAARQDERLRSEEERETLRQILAAVSLNGRERAIVERRLLADEPGTLAEVGETLGLSRERVRQIEEGLMHKLRSAAKRLGVEQNPA